MPRPVGAVLPHAPGVVVKNDSARRASETSLKVNALVEAPKERRNRAMVEVVPDSLFMVAEHIEVLAIKGLKIGMNFVRFSEAPEHVAKMVHSVAIGYDFIVSPDQFAALLTNVRKGPFAILDDVAVPIVLVCGKPKLAHKID